MWVAKTSGIVWKLGQDFRNTQESKHTFQRDPGPFLQVVVGQSLKVVLMQLRVVINDLMAMSSETWHPTNRISHRIHGTGILPTLPWKSTKCLNQTCWICIPGRVWCWKNDKQNGRIQERRATNSPPTYQILFQTCRTHSPQNHPDCFEQWHVMTFLLLTSFDHGKRNIQDRFG